LRVAAAPLAPSERLALVDVLRGVAILGVLASYTIWSLGSPPPARWTRLDRAVDWLADLLIDGKFITLFAFLFGVGTAQQWRRIAAAGRDPVPLYLRRITFLFCAGLLHGVLLRDGDILAPYALIGFALLAFRTAPNRVLAISAMLLLIAPYVLEIGIAAAGVTMPSRPGPTAGNLMWMRYWYLTNPLFSWPRVLALMVLGVLADRTRVMSRLAVDGRFARSVLVVALPAALVARVLTEWLTWYWHGSRTVAHDVGVYAGHHVTAWLLAAVYTAAFALLCQRPGWSERLRWLRAEGRMAFTNYLLQAGLVVPVCIAFGLFDNVRPTLGLALAVGAAAIQIPFSVWWLERHPFGPMEWLWRRVTYGRVAPAAAALASSA
jgi:uncharacterized protein